MALAVRLKRAKLYAEDPSDNYTEDTSALQAETGEGHGRSRAGRRDAAKAG